MMVEYIDNIFKGIKPKSKDEILKNSKKFIFLTSVKDTSIENIFVGNVVKTCDSSDIKLNDHGYFFKSNAGTAKFNSDIVYMDHEDCFSDLNAFFAKKENKQITPVKLPLKYYIDKRIYENEKKKGLDYVWIFALNRVEFYRDPRRMHGKPFGKSRAIEKVAEELQLDEQQLSNHYSARCQCVRWARRDFKNA